MKGRMKIDSRWCLIRGAHTANDVRRLWDSFRTKYPDTKLTMLQWATSYGRIYLTLDQEERQ